MRPDRAAPAPAQTTCCHHRTAQDRPSEPKELPARPGVECCCQRDVTVPEKPVEPPEPAALVLPPVADMPAVLVGQAHGDTAGLVLPPGPRLHVLQCEWRC
jgi:hypothetical protein